MSDQVSLRSELSSSDNPVVLTSPPRDKSATSRSNSASNTSFTLTSKRDDWAAGNGSEFKLKNIQPDYIGMKFFYTAIGAIYLVAFSSLYIQW